MATVTVQAAGPNSASTLEPKLQQWDATNIVKPGDIGFWPDGSCITIAYGATPISRYGESRLACNCNIWGDALDDVAELANIQPGTRVMVDIWHAENLDQAS